MDIEFRVSSSTLEALSAMSFVKWRRISYVGASNDAFPLRLRAEALFIEAADRFRVSVDGRDIIPQWEAFRLSVSRYPDDQHIGSVGRSQSSRLSDSDESLAAFVDAFPTLLLATRRHTVPEWARAKVSTVLIEDLLVLRDSSGQMAYIAADNEQPHSLIVTRTPQQLPCLESEVVSMRIL